MKYFVTGNDTGSGKTYVTAMLVRAARAAGLDCVGMKPLCCGDRDDAEILHAAAGGRIPLDKVNPVWLRTPAAPLVASMIEERPLDLALVHECFRELNAAHESLLVEGVGGWLCPIAQDYFVRDMARDCGFPVLVVAANQLGALNHTLLTVQAIQAAGLVCAGVILNTAAAPETAADAAAATNGAILESLLDVPLLLQIDYGQAELSAAKFRWLASGL